MDYILGAITAVLGVLNTNLYIIFIITLFGMLGYLFYKANKTGTLDWTDVICKPETGQVSLTKILNLVGGLIATWIMVYQTTTGNMTWDLFVIYLTYCASIEGFSKFVAAKYNGPQGDSARGAADLRYIATGEKWSDKDLNGGRKTIDLDDK